MAEPTKRSKKYWETRFVKQQESQLDIGFKYNEYLQKQYDIAMMRIERDINNWYARFAKNNQISFSEAKQWLTSKELKEFRWDVEDYIKYGRENALDPKWMKELENASARVHISRLESLKLQAQNHIEVLYGNQIDGLDRTMREIYTEGYYHTAYEIQKGFNVGYDLMRVNDDMLDTILRKPWTPDGSNFSMRNWKHRDQLVNVLETEFTQMILRGESPDRLIKTISTKFNTSKTNAARLVMTESAYFASASQQKAYKDLSVEKYEIVATLDNSTSDICIDADEWDAIPLADYQPGVTAPPFHVFCRSVTIPYFDDNYGERAARDADGKTYYVPADMKYNDWKDSFVEQTKPKSDIIKTKANVSSLTGHLPDDHIVTMTSILENAPDECVDVWNKYQDKIKIENYAYKGTPHYSPGKNLINLNIERDKNNHMGNNTTIFHEIGHLFDANAGAELQGNPNYTWYKFSKMYENGAFDTKLKEEAMKHVDEAWKELKKTDKKVQKVYAYKVIEAEIRKLPPNARADISDMFEGLTSSAINGGYGHGKTYWKTHNSSSEAFAEMYSASVNNPDSLEQIKKYFPESYDLFLEMLKVMVK